MNNSNNNPVMTYSNSNPNTPNHPHIPDYTFEDLKNKQVFVHLLEDEDDSEGDTDIEVYLIETEQDYNELGDAIQTYSNMGILDDYYAMDVKHR
jgi:hypothetical protein